jgi:hypothetical protein
VKVMSIYDNNIGDVVCVCVCVCVREREREKFYNDSINGEYKMKFLDHFDQNVIVTVFV